MAYVPGNRTYRLKKKKEKETTITKPEINQEKYEGNPQYDNKDRCQERNHSRLEEVQVSRREFFQEMELVEYLIQLNVDFKMTLFSTLHFSL